MCCALPVLGVQMRSLRKWCQSSELFVWAGRETLWEVLQQLLLPSTCDDAGDDGAGVGVVDWFSSFLLLR